MKRPSIHDIIAMGAVAICVSSVVVACGTATKGDAKEPTGSNNAPGTRIHVVQMPDGFRNVAVACDGTNEVFVTSRGAVSDATPAASSVFVIPDSKRCGGTG